MKQKSRPQNTGGLLKNINKCFKETKRLSSGRQALDLSAFLRS